MSKWSILCLICRSAGYLGYIEAGILTLQIMIFVYVCSTWGIVELKTRFETWITRNDVYGVTLFHLYYLITLMAYLCSQRLQTYTIRILFWLVDLQTICAKYRLEMRIHPRDNIRKCLLDMRHRWTKNAFWDVKGRNYINGVSLFHLSYLITLIAYLWSQWTPYVHINYFMFHWSIYGLLVLNTAWKNDFLLMMIFVNVWSTWRTVQLKTRFETWITGNDVNGVCFTFLL
jgi:hypothetical protein